MRKKKDKIETQKARTPIGKTLASKKKAAVKPKKQNPQVHSWRVCPYGEHWVRTNSFHIPPSKTHPDGSVTTRHKHCARNPSGKDQLYPEEIQEIAFQNFSKLKISPCPLPSSFGEHGTKYDDLIAGWVQYWNDVLKPNEPLDPNLVKALIASESGFDPNQIAKKKNSNSARGLMQITNDTRKLLDGFHGDLKDHLVTATKAELNDPNVNICAGVRWLFEKKLQASFHMKKPASWVETVWEYKGLRVAKNKQEAENIKNIFNKFYQEFRKCGKS